MCLKIILNYSLGTNESVVIFWYFFHHCLYLFSQQLQLEISALLSQVATLKSERQWGQAGLTERQEARTKEGRWRGMGMYLPLVDTRRTKTQ